MIALSYSLICIWSFLQVVAPVRETCAQTLGVTLHHLNMESVKEVLSILSQLLVQREWEVRHGGLLGIKYLLAVRQVFAKPSFMSIFWQVL